MKGLKNKKVLIPIISILIVVLIIGISYAFFDADLYHFFKTESSISANKLELKFNGTKEIDFDNADPGDRFEKTFTLENKGNREVKFNLYMENITNEFTSDLVYRLYLTNSSGTVISTLIPETPLPQTNNGKTYFMKGIRISSSAKIYFKLEIEYLYKIEDQSINEGKSFAGTVGVDSNGVESYVALSGAEKIQKLLPIDKWFITNTDLTSIEPTDGICTNSFVYDDAGNLRYNMEMPCNFVCFNNECPSVSITYGIDNIYSEEITTFNSLQACNSEKEGYYSNNYSGSCRPYYYVSGGWRIVGVIDGKLKLIRNDSLETTYYDYDDNYWNNSSINNYLNNDYINNLQQGTVDYIADGTWYIGNEDISNVKTASQLYNIERSTLTVYEYDENEYEYAYVQKPNTWTGKIALMSASDYGYASKASCFSRNVSEYNTGLDQYFTNGEIYYRNYNETPGCVMTNWIARQGISDITSPYLYEKMTIDLSKNSELLAIDTNGELTTDSPSAYSDVYPTLFLNDNVKIASGNGSFSTPYRLSLN